MTSTYESPRRVLLRPGADPQSKTMRTLEPLLSMSPGTNVRIVCASASAARLVEKHTFVSFARARGVEVDVKIVDERREFGVGGLTTERAIIDESLGMSLFDDPFVGANRAQREHEAPWLSIWRRNDPDVR